VTPRDIVTAGHGYAEGVTGVTPLKGCVTPVTLPLANEAAESDASAQGRAAVALPAAGPSQQKTVAIGMSAGAL